MTYYHRHPVAKRTTKKPRPLGEVSLKSDGEGFFAFMFLPLSQLALTVLPKGEPLNVTVRLVYSRTGTAGVCFRVVEG